MLLIGETFKQRKADLLDNIKVCRQLIRVVNDKIKEFPSLEKQGLELIDEENAIIKMFFSELVELERWWAKEGKNAAKEKLLSRSASKPGR